MRKHAGGRPTKYKEDYPAQMVKYFEKAAKEGKLPFLSRWAREEAGVSEQTALTWTEAHAEFLEAYKKAKEIQKEVLIENALSGKFQQTFAIFTAKNITDMRDKTEVENRTEMHLTGFEHLKDDELDAVITKFKTQLGQSPGREGEAGGGISTQVRLAAPEAEGSEPV